MTTREQLKEADKLIKEGYEPDDVMLLDDKEYEIHSGNTIEENDPIIPEEHVDTNEDYLASLSKAFEIAKELKNTDYSYMSKEALLDKKKELYDDIRLCKEEIIRSSSNYMRVQELKEDILYDERQIILIDKRLEQIEIMNEADDRSRGK